MRDAGNANLPIGAPQFANREIGVPGKFVQTQKSLGKLTPGRIG